MPSESSAPATITTWLRDWRLGDADALPKLTAAVYQELHRVASRYFRDERSDPVIQPTVLVHELYLRLPNVQTIDWQCRGQFMAVAAKIMRNILIDHARRRQALKRDNTSFLRLAEPGSQDAGQDLNVISLHDALDEFSVLYPRHARVVELRFFGGLTAEETAEALRAQGIESSLRTVERDWTFAKAWLYEALAER